MNRTWSVWSEKFKNENRHTTGLPEYISLDWSTELILLSNHFVLLVSSTRKDVKLDKKKVTLFKLNS